MELTDFELTAAIFADQERALLSAKVERPMVAVRSIGHKAVQQSAELGLTIQTGMGEQAA